MFNIFCFFHDYKIIDYNNTIHVWSVEQFPSNPVYRYEYTYYYVKCDKCGKRRANYKLRDINHPDRHSKNSLYIDMYTGLIYNESN